MPHGGPFDPDEFGPEVAEDVANVFGKLQVADVYGTGSPLQLRRIRAKNIPGFEDTEVHLDQIEQLAAR